MKCADSTFATENQLFFQGSNFNITGKIIDVELKKSIFIQYHLKSNISLFPLVHDGLYHTVDQQKKMFTCKSAILTIY